MSFFNVGALVSNVAHALKIPRVGTRTLDPRNQEPPARKPDGRAGRYADS